MFKKVKTIIFYYTKDLDKEFEKKALEELKEAEEIKKERDALINRLETMRNMDPVDEQFVKDAKLGRALRYCYEYDKGFISAYGRSGIRITQDGIQTMLLLYTNWRVSNGH